MVTVPVGAAVSVLATRADEGSAPGTRSGDAGETEVHPTTSKGADRKSRRCITGPSDGEPYRNGRRAYTSF
jgi:hypothetical protein